MKIRKSKMKKFVLETLDFTSIFKGYRIPIPFFLLCIDIIKSSKKVPPRQILKSNYVGQTHIISFHHKDAIGRETQKCLKQICRETLDFTII